MNIDFSSIEEQNIPNFKGGEGSLKARMYVDDSVRIINGYLEPGSSIGMHKHEGSTETVYILEGQGRMIYDGEEEILSAGACSYCPEGHTHSLINDGKETLHFLGVVPNV